MLRYKIHTKLIYVIVDIYTNYKTKIFFNNTEIFQTEISNGIRQGCNGSTVIFSMITYFIIEKLNSSNGKFNSEVCALSAIFFADDGMFLLPNEEETKESIKLLTEVTK